MTYELIRNTLHRIAVEYREGIKKNLEAASKIKEREDKIYYVKHPSFLARVRNLFETRVTSGMPPLAAYDRIMRELNEP